MWSGLGKFVLERRIQAILVTGVLSFFGLLIPMFSFISSGVVPGLVTLRKGALAGIQTITGSLLMVGIFVIASGMNPTVVFVMILCIWLPVWLCAWVLRNSCDIGRTAVMAAIFGLTYILLSHAIMGDVTAMWHSWLTVILDRMQQQAGQIDVKEVVNTTAPLMNAMVAAGFFISLFLTLLLARWWQAKLFNPGGFRKEFQAMRLPLILIFPILAALGQAVFSELSAGTLLMDVLILLIAVYLFQGIAAMHRKVATRKLPQIWLVLMYVSIFLIPQLMLFIACIGLVESIAAGNRNSTPPTNDNR